MKSLRRWLIALVCLLAMAAAGALLWLEQGLPEVDELPGRLHVPSVRITDRSGRLLYELIDQQGGRHLVVPLQDIPQTCRLAAIATEDRSFYTNPGVDLRGVLRSLWINLRSGETRAGGSTITQQVARNLLMTSQERAQRSLLRKLRESLLAWQINRRFAKDEILGFYLNQTYYGGMAYGIEAAARTFFAKPAADLDLAECALLAGLPQAPALYNPFTDLESARTRQQTVLSLMLQAGFISQEQSRLAAREKLVLAEQPYPIEAPHFVMMVRRQIDELFSPQEIFELGGLEVRTTLDLDWQRLAERAVAHQLEALARANGGLGHNVNTAALVAIDPATGDVKALLGSPDYFDPRQAGAVNMAISPRQPGSALKPIIYAAAFDPQSASGGWTAATMILDVRTSFMTQDGKAYTPANYDLKEHGPVLAREALASSLNIPAVIALDHIGLSSLFDISAKMGITTFEDPEAYDLSLALGGGAVRLVDLTAAYGVFANRGYRVEPRLILEARDLQENPVYAAREPARTQVLDGRIAWLISDILSDRDARRLGFGPNSILQLDRPAAVKTGTTSNFHDNWTVGYTPDLVVGVWSGNTDYQPMREVNGLTGAAPIWHEFMRAALSGQPERAFERPAGLQPLEICALSGLLPTSACAYRRLEWFLEGSEPHQADSFYREVFLDRETGRLAGEQTQPSNRVREVVLDLPLQAQAWAHSRGLRLYSDLLLSAGASAAPAPAGAADPTGGESLPELRLVAPADGSVYYLAAGFSDLAQRIPLEVVGTPGVRDVELWVDGVQIGEAGQAPARLWWTLVPGEHQIWVQGIGPDGGLVKSQPAVIQVNR